MQIRVIGKARGVIAGVVGRDDDVAFSRKLGREDQAFAVPGSGDGRNVEVLVGCRAVRVEQYGARTLTARVGARRHHESAGSGREFALAAHRLVLQLIDVDRTGRCIRQRDEVLTQRIDAKLGQQVRGRVRTDLGRRVGQQLAARRSRFLGGRRGRRHGVVVATVTAAGSDENAGAEQGEEELCAHREIETHERREGSAHLRRIAKAGVGADSSQRAGGSLRPDQLSVSVCARSVRFHHQSGASARHVSDHGGAAMKFGHGSQVDREGEDYLLSLTQTQVRRLDENAGGAEIDGLAELAATTGNGDVDGGTGTVPRMQAAFHLNQPHVFSNCTALACADHYANVCMLRHGP